MRSTDKPPQVATKLDYGLFTKAFRIQKEKENVVFIKKIFIKKQQTQRQNFILYLLNIVNNGSQKQMLRNVSFSYTAVFPKETTRLDKYIKMKYCTCGGTLVMLTGFIIFVVLLSTRKMTFLIKMPYFILMKYNMN